MQSVMINEYKSVQDYCSPNPVCTRYIEPLRIRDLLRYAITTGGVSGRRLSARSMRFYRSLVMFALEERRCPDDYLYCQTDDYAASETSLKSVVSFLLGMVGAHVIAEKRYGVSHLLHLKDSRINYELKGASPYGALQSNCHPDFVGIANGKPLVLMEAKGASRGRVSSGAVRHAYYDQLGNIAKVSYQGSSYDVAKCGIKKCVACSAFRREPYGSVWELGDVDPAGKGEASISFDYDRALYCYYQPVVSLIASCDFREGVDHKGGRVVLAEGDYGKVCLKAPIWKACSSRGSVDEAGGLSEVIREVAAEEPSWFETDSASCGKDGVSVIIA